MHCEKVRETLPNTGGDPIRTWVFDQTEKRKIFKLGGEVKVHLDSEILNNKVWLKELFNLLFYYKDVLTMLIRNERFLFILFVTLVFGNDARDQGQGKAYTSVEYEPINLCHKRSSLNYHLPSFITCCAQC